MHFPVFGARWDTFDRYFRPFCLSSFFLFRTIFAELKTVVGIAATIISLLMTIPVAAKVTATRVENGRKMRGTGRHIAKRHAERC